MSEAINRRTFLSNSAAAIAGGATLANTALSYGKILGAKDRIQLCHVGIGGGGTELGFDRLESRAQPQCRDECRVRSLAAAKTEKFCEHPAAA